MTLAFPPIQIGIGSCTGRGLAITSPRVEVTALVAEWLTAPVEWQHVEHLVEQRVALVEVDAERVELRFEVAGADPEDASAARQRVDGGGGLREQERVAVRGDGQVGEQAEPLGCRGHVTERDERVERLVPARRQPPRPRGGVLGEGEAHEPGRLGGTREFEDRSHAEEVAVGVR